MLVKIAFVSNYFNHHQSSFSNCMDELTGHNYQFISAEPMEEERQAMGWGNISIPGYVVNYYETPEKCADIISNADVVIFGNAPYDLILPRLKEQKLTFLYSERLYKSGYEAWKWPVRLVRFWKKYGRYKNLYLLCASAFSAVDYAKTFTFLGKAYKWGYFPETRYYDALPKKEPNTILWTARMIDWKHPEHTVSVARRLKAEGYHFRLTMLGNGELLEEMRTLVKAEKLDDCVDLPGAVPAEEVRDYMEKAQIFLFTSDRNEGWGAVLNESMNSGCSVVACSAIGSVPYLLQDGKTGFTYPSGDVDALYEKVKYLLDNPKICREMGGYAYKTMIDQWNAETAARRLLALSQALLAGNTHPDLYDDGPCSGANAKKWGNKYE